MFRNVGFTLTFNCLAGRVNNVLFLVTLKTFFTPLPLVKLPHPNLAEVDSRTCSFAVGDGRSRYVT